MAHMYWMHSKIVKRRPKPNTTDTTKKKHWHMSYQSTEFTQSYLQTSQRIAYCICTKWWWVFSYLLFSIMNERVCFIVWIVHWFKTHSPIYRFDWFSFFLLRVSSQNVISGWWLKRQMIFWLFFFSLHFPVELFELYKDFTITARFDALNRMALFMYDSYYQLVLRKITEWIAYSFMFTGTNGTTLARHIKTYFNTLYIIVYI